MRLEERLANVPYLTPTPREWGLSGMAAYVLVGGLSSGSCQLAPTHKGFPILS